MNEWKENFSQKYKGIYSTAFSAAEKELTIDTFKNTCTDNDMWSTIKQSDGFRTYFQEFRQLPEPYQDEVDKPECSQISEDYWEHEESQKTLSPTNLTSKPPIYRKKRNSSVDKQSDRGSFRCREEQLSPQREEDEDNDGIEDNLYSVEESLNGIKR